MHATDLDKNDELFAIKLRLRGVESGKKSVEGGLVLIKNLQSSAAYSRHAIGN